MYGIFPMNEATIVRTGEDKRENNQKIVPFLWFDSQAEDAAKFYVSIFQNSSIDGVVRYGKEGFEIHHMIEGTVMTIDFNIEGQKFIALNGGPVFKFNEAISFQIYCETQEEVNYYWDKLSEGGDPNAQQCGWLKDKYGVSWQVVPTILIKMIKDRDINKSQKVMKAMLQMKKIDIQALADAYGQA
jgi:predicted 3-demethylubiquinone-9 3-methyltransferase (glyoxalase superfamily)